MIIAAAHWPPLLHSRSGWYKLFLFTALLSFLFIAGAEGQAGECVVKIDRAARLMIVVDGSGKTVLSSRIGIGRGGLRTKRSMDDLITPTGSFVVDIILTSNKDGSQVSSSLRHRFRQNRQYDDFLKTSADLSRLLTNMNALDFDGNGVADTAYGGAYIGLDPADQGDAIAGKSDRNKVSGSICGTKARIYQKKVSWYSIAIHGTPHPEYAIGAATSGGCIHVDDKTLQHLLGLVSIGTKVEIFDGKIAK